ncbi:MULTISPECIES: adenylate/guanylate cyclase domain-containing protein [unclassified Rhizobium]|jgi:class 3 adenylate cyclase|uniref:adenylate/guanylate cyclase domain-containing protein n=1 Tax=unclassified Rhizobium TaxID=2613769 RepID=UPI0006458B0B|nr:MULTISPECIES: adenylate/guanylate cyclase domain-containing protein [unclassified Rhizobium]MBN8949980.1 adenylate/guanylate cyclase domain-containing protein [Rhizobium tropici]OJY62646.1 MAG: adenylate/guanylate cyclase domain-containing protein [Rhizobium sp. 60-20]RKD74723.1 class 3 adenylate cyclase [Rhizobium sp. WW_1]
MTETQTLFGVLRHSAQPDIVDTIERLVLEAPDRKLNRMNALAFATEGGFDEEQTINAFLHGSRLGLFEMSWNIVCPSCGGVLDANTSLKTVQSETYRCVMCAAGYEPTLDDMVEVTFTISPRVRRIEAHNPHDLSPREYFRQIYWGSGVNLPEDGYEEKFDQFVLEALELPSGEKAVVSLQLPAGFVIIFEPVTHAAQFIEVQGEASRERQALSFVFDRMYQHTDTMELKPGSVRISLENHSVARTLPSIVVANEVFHTLIGQRRPFLTAKQLLSNQTFRDIYRTDTIDINQRLKITSLTFLFTDLRGSTALYERVGDLAAFDLVRAHFSILHEIVGAEAGAVVKTIGDAVMATFPTPDRALVAAMRMREAMSSFNKERGNDDLLLKIGIHEGPCIAVSLNERQDYFGQTVNIASRVQHLATSSEIFATSSVLNNAPAAELLTTRGLKPQSHQVALRGITDAIDIFAIP